MLLEQQSLDDYTVIGNRLWNGFATDNLEDLSQSMHNIRNYELYWITENTTLKIHYFTLCIQVIWNQKTVVIPNKCQRIWVEQAKEKSQSFYIPVWLSIVHFAIHHYLNMQWLFKTDSTKDWWVLLLQLKWNDPTYCGTNTSLQEIVWVFKWISIDRNVYFPTLLSVCVSETDSVALKKIVKKKKQVFTPQRYTRIKCECWKLKCDWKQYGEDRNDAIQPFAQ